MERDGPREPSHASKRLEPETLALSLERWAMRREKILELLDVKAARRARALAERCHVLARTRGENGAWHEAWLRLREDVLQLLSGSSGAELEVGPEASQGRRRASGPPVCVEEQGADDDIRSA